MSGPSSFRSPLSAALVAAILGSSLFAPPAAAQQPSHASLLHREQGLASPTLLFEQNQGQTDPRVRFVARTGNTHLFFTEDELIWSMDAPCNLESSLPPSPVPALSSRCETEGEWVVRMSFSGGHSFAPLVGEQLHAGRSHYMVGRNARDFRLAIPSFARLSRHQIYPGIDAVYYGREGRLEYDFVIEPGADPRSIRLQFGGASELLIDDEGNLVLRQGSRSLVQQAPALYQEVAGGRVEVAGGWEILAPNLVGFRVGQYETTRPLVIDPVVFFSTCLGGSAEDQIRDIAVDRSGHIYITGFTRSLDFPIGGASQASSTGGSIEAFVTKLAPDGSELLYSTYIGGAGADVGTGIALDGTDVIIALTTSSSDLPTSSLIQPTYGGGIFDAAVAKITDDGSRLTFLTYLGGSGYDFTSLVKVDRDGSIVVTGASASVDFPLSQPIQDLNAGGFDLVLSRIDPSADRLVLSTYLGGSGLDQAFALAVDSSGRAFVGGGTQSSDFPTLRAVQPAFGGVLDGFLAVFDSQGISSSSYIGGSGFDMVSDIEVSGGTFLTGWTSSLDFPVASPLQQELAGNFDAFVTRIASDASPPHLLFSTYIGASQEDLGLAIDVRGGRIFVAGRTASADFPLAAPIQGVHGGGPFDVFLLEMAENGMSIPFSTFLGGAGGDQINHGIAVGCHDSVVVAGWTGSTDFPTTPHAWQPVFAGGGDGFVAQVSTSTAEVSVARLIARVEELVALGLVSSGERGHLLAKLDNAAKFLGRGQPDKARSFLVQLLEELERPRALPHLLPEVRNELACAVRELLRLI